jgi:transcriptional regulator with XRE-family HTH domain
MSDDLLPFSRMLQSIDDLAHSEYAYTVRHMLEWEQMRARFKAEREARQLTQQQVAQRGGVDQSSISKIETTTDYTPYVDTFVNAIHGLGLTATAFFAEIEGLQNSGKNVMNTVLPDVSRDADTIVRLDRTIEGLHKIVMAIIDHLHDFVLALEQVQTREQAPRKTPRKTAAPRKAATRQSRGA